MNRTEFAEEVRHFRTHAESLRQNRSGVTQAGLLLVSILQSPTQWSHQAMLDVLSGNHGEGLAGYAVQALHEGCCGNIGRGDRAVLGVSRSFAYWCIANDRVATLHAVIDLGLSIKVGEHGLGATTPAGRVLDRLSCILIGEPAPMSMSNSFLSLVDGKNSNWSAKTVSDCLELQVELDPHHKGIAKRAGTEIGAKLTEALLRISIRKGAAAESAESIPATDVAPRRRMSV